MYQGHCSDGSGVQKHSCGGLYPYVIGVRERQIEGQFYRTWIVIGPDVDEYECPTHDEAVRFAQVRKQSSDCRRRLLASSQHANSQWARYGISRR